jgi:hypothetical protein
LTVRPVRPSLGILENRVHLPHSVGAERQRQLAAPVPPDALAWP